MGFTLSRETDFSGLKSNVNTLLSSVETAGNNAGTVSSESSSSLASLNFGSWDDTISSNLKNYCLAVKAGMDEISSDVSGGAFASLRAALTDLVSGLGQCAKYKSNYFYQCDRLRTVSDEKQRAAINELIVAEGRNLDSCINYCQGIVNVIEAIQFNGTVTYTPGGGASVEDTSALYEASKGEDKTKTETEKPKEYYTSDGNKYHMEGTEAGLQNVLVLTDTDTGYIYDGWTSSAVGRDMFFSSDQNEGYAIVDGVPMHFSRRSDGYFYYDNGVSINDNPNK